MNLSQIVISPKVEYEREYCDVLKGNKPEWNVICGDVHKFDGSAYCGVDLLAGGMPAAAEEAAEEGLVSGDVVSDSYVNIDRECTVVGLVEKERIG